MQTREQETDPRASRTERRSKCPRCQEMTIVTVPFMGQYAQRQACDCDLTAVERVKIARYGK